MHAVFRLSCRYELTYNLFFFFFFRCHFEASALAQRAYPSGQSGTSLKLHTNENRDEEEKKSSQPFFFVLVKWFSTDETEKEKKRDDEKKNEQTWNEMSHKAIRPMTALGPRLFLHSTTDRNLFACLHIFGRSNYFTDEDFFFFFHLDLPFGFQILDQNREEYHMEPYFYSNEMRIAIT